MPGFFLSGLRAIKSTNFIIPQKARDQTNKTIINYSHSCKKKHTHTAGI